jgi:hypothetical protein
MTNDDLYLFTSIYSNALLFSSMMSAPTKKKAKRSKDPIQINAAYSITIGRSKHEKTARKEKNGKG